MATDLGIKMKSLFIFTFFMCISICTVNSDDAFPTKLDIETWSDALSDSLSTNFSAATNYKFVSNLYNNKSDQFTYLKEFQLKFEKVDVEQLVSDYAKVLGDMLLKKMEALNRSVEAAEKAAGNHTWNNNIKKTDFYCLKAKNIMKNDSRLLYSERFKQEIIANESSVHIPVEIYDGDVEILNGLKWSAALDKVFTENYEKDPEILWQYFGSQSGFMRTLPASRWDTGDDVDLYDVRRRPWYTQGSSSPKDMLILIDTSGSVYGQALELMKVAVKSLLDTLGENDFVYIAQFSEEAHGVSKCFNGTFVQANYLNKMKLRDEVDQIKARGMADFSIGLEFAFKQFIKLENETEGRRGAGCNRMIMLLTDGGTDDADEIFKKYNPKDNQNYRLFSYAVGPTANPVAKIRWMACANRGYFSQIPAMGAVRSKVQEYVNVIARPLALNQAKNDYVLWTSVYPGANDVGLGMMTTVTLPVYNKTDSNGTTDQTILGVMGIDVTTAAMLKLAPLRKFGPNGFPFAINANGYIVFHPKLHVEKDLKDPPNVDFLDVEIESPEKLQLRKDMILQKKGEKDLETYIISNDERHVDHAADSRVRKYVYQGIDKTTFSVGASVPLYHQYNLNINLKKSLDKANWLNLLNDTYSALLIADWEYYENFTADESAGGTVFDLLEALNNTKEYTWNEELRNHLLFDLFVTNQIEASWNMIHKSNIFPNPGHVVGAFIATNGGLTKIYPKSDDLVTVFQNQRDPWNATYFKRAMETTDYIFSAPYLSESVDLQEENVTAGHVMAVRSVSIENGDVDQSLRGANPNYRAAVLGAVFSHEYMRKKIEDASKTSGTRDCTDQRVACYLLDDGAFLIATNQDKYNTSIGRFFGRVDPQVMHKLYNLSMYKSLEHYDFIGTCEISKSDITSAANINIPLVTLFYEFLTFNWWTSVVTWTFTNLNVYSFLYPAPVYADEEFFAMEKTRDCMKKNAQFYYKDLRFVEGQIDCEIKNRNCSREFMAQRLPQTNLLLVVADAEEDDCAECQKQVEPLIQESEEVRNKVEAEKHFCSLKPRYRRATSKCYDKHPKENTHRCAGSRTHPVSMAMIFLVPMATLLMTRR